MPKYKYLVINQENIQLEGTIGAQDEQSARQELNQLGFSVLSMSEIHQEENVVSESQLPVFEFAATDKNGRHVVGTIQSADRYSAYKRLISEYAFQVEYVIDDNLDEATKQARRLEGAFDLQDMYAEENMLLQKQETGEEKDLKEFAQKQEILKSQINFVMNKVKEMLDLYEKDMKPETKAKIRHYIDKLLRIRTSTNLDYIRKTAEDLLNFLQQEELFLNEQAHVNDRTRMLIEAKSMTMELKRNKTNNAGITYAMRKWRQDHIYKNPSPSTTEKILNGVLSIFIGKTVENEEITEIRRQIATNNDQIWQYLRLYMESKSPEFKSITKEGLKKMLARRKKLKAELKTAKKSALTAAGGSAEDSTMRKFAVELHEFSGWILVFYLIYYFVSIYLSSKNFGLTDIPDYFYVYKSSFLKYFLAIIFLLHSSLSVKMVFFKNNEVASYIISPVFILSTLLIIFNF